MRASMLPSTLPLLASIALYPLLNTVAAFVLGSSSTIKDNIPYLTTYLAIYTLYTAIVSLVSLRTIQKQKFGSYNLFLLSYHFAFDTLVSMLLSVASLLVLQDLNGHVCPLPLDEQRSYGKFRVPTMRKRDEAGLERLFGGPHSWCQSWLFISQVAIVFLSVGFICSRWWAAVSTRKSAIELERLESGFSPRIRFDVSEKERYFGLD